MPSAHQQLEQQLAEQGRDYLALSPPGRDRVHIRFTGLFQQRPVVWDADLMTLQAWYKQVLHQNSMTAVPTATLRQFIKIPACQGDVIPIQIALNVPLIDEPTILKCMIMVHNYKRLQAGLHEYGQPVPVELLSEKSP